MGLYCLHRLHFYSRTPHGVRGLKYDSGIDEQHLESRTPHGVRGLKSERLVTAGNRRESHPAWGAWIEMQGSGAEVRFGFVAPRMGCVD